MEAGSSDIARDAGAGELRLDETRFEASGLKAITFDDPIATILWRQKKLKDEDFTRIQGSSPNNLSLQDLYKRYTDVSEIDIARALAKHHGMPFLNLDIVTPSPSDIAVLSRDDAFRMGCMLCTVREKRFVAIADPQSRFNTDELRWSQIEPNFAMVTPSALRAAMLKAYPEQTRNVSIIGGKKASEQRDVDPLSRQVDTLIQQGVKLRASDIRFEPSELNLRVRYRIDGIEEVVKEFNANLAPKIISRLKVLGDLDIAEKRHPQDGHIKTDVDGKGIDIRISIIPTVDGEAATLRILDRDNIPSLRALGFSTSSREWFERIIRQPSGLILVTGMTGSGKTTTLYSALSELNDPTIDIVTAEDPVEYRLRGVNQCQVNSAIQLGFPDLLRSFLRQNPDIILVGEIRDKETAEIAVQAALTGHRIFSTLHASDTVSAAMRCINLGASSHEVAETLRGVVAQRLVRVLCSQCTESYKPEPAELKLLGLSEDKDLRLRHARGCECCKDKGYLGRVGVFETLDIDAALQEMVRKQSSLGEMREYATQNKLLRTLRQDGLEKVLAGVTTTQEYLRVLGGTQ